MRPPRRHHKCAKANLGQYARKKAARTQGQRDEESRLAREISTMVRLRPEESIRSLDFALKTKTQRFSDQTTIVSLDESMTQERAGSDSMILGPAAAAATCF